MRCFVQRWWRGRKMCVGWDGEATIVRDFTNRGNQIQKMNGSGTESRAIDTIE